MPSRCRAGTFNSQPAVRAAPPIEAKPTFYLPTGGFSNPLSPAPLSPSKQLATGVTAHAGKGAPRWA